MLLQNKRLNVSLIFYCLVLITTQKVLGQHGAPIIFDHYGVSEGFDASQVLCLQKSKDGYLWIGTEQGLLRYDGHSFKTFRTNPFDTTTISSNYIRKIEEDKRGHLWVLALPDLDVFDPNTGKSKRIKIPPAIDKEKHLDIRCIKYDESNDIIWFGTNKGLLYSIGGDVTLQQELIPVKETVTGIHAIEIDKNGVLWLCANDGLWRYDLRDCSIQNFHRPDKSADTPADDGFINSYLDKKNNIIWIGTWVHGLMKFEITTEKMSVYTYGDKSKIQNGILCIDQSGFCDEENLLWLGTTDGIKTFDIITNKFESYKSDEYYDNKGISGAGFCFEPTEAEGMWIGTYRGLHRYDTYKQNVKVIDIPLLDAQADWTLGNIVFEVSGQKDSIIWFGVGYESFYNYDMILKKEIPIRSVLKAYCDKVDPYTLYIDSKNILWLSSAKKGLIGYDLTINRLIIPSLCIANQAVLKVLKILEDSNGDLWLGSTSGMYIYNREQNEVREQSEICKFVDHHKLSNYAFRFTIDSKDKAWIFSTQKYEEDDALYSFDPLTKEFKLYTQSQYPALKILKSLEAIENIGNDKLVITSYNGFCVLNTSNKIPTFNLFETYNEKPLGLFKSIVTDHGGNVWMSSDNGVTRFDPNSNTISNFTYFNSNIGMTPSPEISFSDQTNIIYISQNQAINSISISDLEMAKPGNVILSDIKISNYTFDSLPSSGQTLTLKSNQNSLELAFTNLSFTDSKHNSYQYQLGGHENNWTTMSDNRLRFNNLGFGNYLLKVKAENSFGITSPNHHLLHINIAPPFWETLWFQLFVIGLISFLIYSFFTYRDLQRQSLEKLRLSIARDLHDDMGSTLSHIRMLSERESMRGDANKSFKDITDKTAEVMNTMTEIIWSINPKNDSLRNIIGKIQEFAIDTLEPLGIIIHFDIEEVPRIIKLNPENRRHFYLIFKEAINNTAKYSKATQVHFSFKPDANHLITAFSDNGIGFDPMLIKRGNGLKNIESRTKALQGKLVVNTNENGTIISLIL